MKSFTVRNIVYTATACFVIVLGTAFFAAGGSFTDNDFFKKVFFTNVSFMGDSLFAFAVAGVMIFLFNRKDAGMKLLFSILVCLFVTQLIKNIFSIVPVKLFFETNSYESAGADVNIISSHVAVAFTLAGFFAIHAAKKHVRFVAGFIALLVTYSRIYIASETGWSVLPAIITAALSVILMMKISAGKSKSVIVKRRRHQATVPEKFSWN